MMGVKELEKYQGSKGKTAQVALEGPYKRTWGRGANSLLVETEKRRRAGPQGLARKAWALLRRFWLELAVMGLGFSYGPELILRALEAANGQG